MHGRRFENQPFGSNHNLNQDKTQSDEEKATGMGESTTTGDWKIKIVDVGVLPSAHALHSQRSEDDSVDHALTKTANGAHDVVRVENVGEIKGEQDENAEQSNVAENRRTTADWVEAEEVEEEKEGHQQADGI